MPKMRQIYPCLVFGLIASGALAEAKRPPDIAFKARVLVVASDGDMQASAYEGAPLGAATGDVLSVIRLDRPLAEARPGTVGVSNSVIGPPAALAVTPDGHYAIVAETRGPHPDHAPDAMLRDLPAGRVITVIDIENPDSPTVVQRLVGADDPLSVSVRGDGKLIAVAYDTTRHNEPPLVLYSFADGRLVSPRTPAIPGFSPGDALKNAAFDDPAQALGLVYAKRPRLSFVRLHETADDITLGPWGNDVPLGPSPFEVRFSPDGRFALVNDMDVPESGSDVRGSVTSIAVAQDTAPDGTPRHAVVSKARTGVLPEGLTVSPDGRWAATTNLERSAYRLDDPRQGFFASVTLLRLDPRTGQLTRVDDFPFNGVIPEGVVFDDTSRHLAVIVFDHFAGRSAGGSVDIWRLAGDFQDPDRSVLVPTGISIPVARGAQSIDVVR